MDLHGLLVDHRRAKWEYFREVVGIEFSSWELGREGIVRELAGLGRDFAFYERNVENFLNSSYMDRCIEVISARRFLENSPRSWNVRVVTGPYMKEEAFRRSVRRFALPRIQDYRRVEDELRAAVLVEMRVRLYFDDKRSHLPAIAASGIRCIQVASANASESSDAFRRYYS